MFHGYGSRATEKSPITQTAKKMFLWKWGDWNGMFIWV
jgi:hypothetical protein